MTDERADEGSFDDVAGAADSLPPINEDPGIGDSNRPLVRAAKGGVVGLIIVTVLSLSIWGAVRDLPGLYGALIGSAIGGGFVLLTIFVVLGTAKTSPTTTMAVVLGSWLAKAVVLIAVLLWIRDMDFYDATALGVTVIAVLVVILATETIAITRTRLINVPEA